MNNFATNLKNRRLELGISQDELAQRLGYKTRSSINKIEKGINDVPRKKVDDFADALQTTPAALLGWEAAPAPILPPSASYDLKALEDRLRRLGYDCALFETAAAASNYVINRCKGKTVGFGDSATCVQMGIFDKIKETHAPEDVFISSYRQNKETGKKAITADIFITTINGVSYETGEMVMLANRGSRIAGALYYPDEAIFLVSRNKIVPDLAAALHRLKNHFAATYSKALGHDNPCTETGKCPGICNSQDTVCYFTTIFHKPEKLLHSTVILINEDLGY